MLANSKRQTKAIKCAEYPRNSKHFGYSLAKLKAKGFLGSQECFIEFSFDIF